MGERNVERGERERELGISRLGERRESQIGRKVN